MIRDLIVYGSAVMGSVLSIGLFVAVLRDRFRPFDREVRIDEDFTADHWRTRDQETRGQLIQLHAKAGAHQKRAGQQKANWK